MSHFKPDATMTERLLELISNQLQFASRQAAFDKSSTNDPYRPRLNEQLEAMRIKIINQRVELGITVDGF